MAVVAVCMVGLPRVHRSIPASLVGVVAATVLAGGDGTFPVDGGDGAHDWIGLAGSAQLPRAIDPPSGQLINANNPTAGSNFPVFIAHDTYGDWRARRILALLAGTAPQSSGTKGPALRRDSWWIVRAATSFPVPVSPWMSTVASVGATRSRME